MTWHKVSFTKDNFKDQNIYAEFGLLLLERLPSGGVGLYSDLIKDDSDNIVGATFYFSPGCTFFCPDLIEQYGAEPCPEPSNVAWLKGTIDSK